MTGPEKPRASDIAFLDGGGELGALMRAHDWTGTPLGAPASWPSSLKTAVRIMLTSQQPFWIGYGPELTYLYNDAYKSIIGGKHPWALGRPFKEVWSEIWDVVGPLGEHVMQHDEGTYSEAQLLIMERHGYQEETHYTFSYSPVPGEDARPAGIICANTDVTPRVIGERQLALLRELAARTVAARSWQDACTLAADSLATDARDLPFAMIHVRAEGAWSLAATSGIDRARAAALRIDANLEEKQTRLIALDDERATLPRGAWTQPPTQAAVLPIAASGQTGRVGALIVGLNPFRKFDDNYRSFLELVAGQIGAAIANAQAYEEERQRAEALAEIDRAKTAFFSNVSHEFRTPLTLMLGPLEDMLAKPADGELPETRGLLEVVHRNGQRLLKLVNTLLDFARIEAGRTHASYEPTELGPLTAELASSFRSACERAGLRLEVDCPPTAEVGYVDREMWEKIVLNLVSNAFKYTLSGGIQVRLRETTGTFELSVQDSGIGIPAEHLPRVFERFQRVEGARGRSHEGSGIGLALVQELVKLHGGSISVRSEPGVGSTFTVAIPKASAHLPAERIAAGRSAASTAVRAGAYVDEALSWLPQAETPAPQSQKSAQRILLADDNADLREYARRLLAELYDVEAVVDGEEALASARKRRPDLIVSDVMMPRLDGFGLLRALRADPELRTIPIILLSARAGEEARVEGLDSGADDYLVKPFSARELQVRAGALLRSATIRREAEAAVRTSEQRLRTFADTAPAMLWITEADGSCSYLSRGWYEFTGQSEEQGMGAGWTSAVHPDDRTRSAEVFLEANRRQEPFSLDYRLRRADGEYRWAIDAGRPRFDADGRFLGFIGSVIDVHERTRAQQALQEADRRKSEFIAMLSHELRNPLAALRNALEFLRMSGKGGGELAPIREMMDRQVNQLVRLVDDLLEMSRISRGAFELRKEHVEIAAVVRSALETCDAAFEAGGHALGISLPEEPLWVEGDSMRLAQVVANLLNNAAKYTRPGGRIEIRTERRDDAAEISVRDNGAGISPHAMPHLFEMFSRGDQSEGNGQGGLGIGLAISRRLVEMHGGTIQAYSAGRGMGSTFTVRLPLAADQHARGAADPGTTAEVAQQRILVVDDNRDSAESLGMLLEFLGAEVRIAGGGPAALDLFGEFDPEVVLLDIGMPEMDGYEVARRIRARDPQRRTSIVALTGWGQEEDRRRSREAGFDHHLVKPVDLDALRALLTSIDRRPGAA